MFDAFENKVWNTRTKVQGKENIKNMEECGKGIFFTSKNE